MFLGVMRREFTPVPHWLSASSGSLSQLTIPHNTRSYLRIISQPERQGPWERANTRDRGREKQREREMKRRVQKERREIARARAHAEEKEDTHPTSEGDWTVPA